MGIAAGCPGFSRFAGREFSMEGFLVGGNWRGLPGKNYRNLIRDIGT